MDVRDKDIDMNRDIDGRNSYVGSSDMRNNWDYHSKCDGGNNNLSS